MAKVSVIQRDLRRRRIVKKYEAKRRELKRRIKDPNLSLEERHAALRQLQALPRDASPVRLRNRCRLTGRPRGYYRKFGLSRNKLREAALEGHIPGMTKASW